MYCSLGHSIFSLLLQQLILPHTISWDRFINHNQIAGGWMTLASWWNKRFQSSSSYRNTNTPIWQLSTDKNILMRVPESRWEITASGRSIEPRNDAFKKVGGTVSLYSHHPSLQPMPCRAKRYPLAQEFSCREKRAKWESSFTTDPLQWILLPSQPLQTLAPGLSPWTQAPG